MPPPAHPAHAASRATVRTMRGTPSTSMRRGSASSGLRCREHREHRRRPTNQWPSTRRPRPRVRQRRLRCPPARRFQPCAARLRLTDLTPRAVDDVATSDCPRRHRRARMACVMGTVRSADDDRQGHDRNLDAIDRQRTVRTGRCKSTGRAYAQKAESHRSSRRRGTE